MPLFVGDEGYFSSIFDFSTEILGHNEKGWYAIPDSSVALVRDTLYESQAQMGDHGFFCNIVENHDEPRGASRYLPPEGQNDYGKKLLAVTMFMRRGLPFLYQGQELGMTNCPFDSIEQIDDIFTRDEYRTALDAGLSPPGSPSVSLPVQPGPRPHAHAVGRFRPCRFFGEYALASGKPQFPGNQRRRRRTGSGFCPAVLQSSDRAAQESALRRYNRIRQL